MKDNLKNIGVWGLRHYDYLKRNSPCVIGVMRAEGKLEQYLCDIDRQANEMFSQLVKQFAESEGITERLKAENQMEWVGRMENIHNRATEIVNNELIYT